MKQLLPILLLILTFSSVFSQEKEMQIQARVLDKNDNPIGDAYIVNYRNLAKAVSRTNGVFDISVLPDDSLMVSHVSYLKKVVRVYELMMNPVIHIEMDTVNIMEVNVLSDPQDEMENAKKNIQSMGIGFNPNAKPDDELSDQEVVGDAVTRENSVLRSESNSLSITKFSISKAAKKRKEKRKTKKARKEMEGEKEE